MISVEERRRRHEFENEILELIDNQDEYTRSDLQGRVTVIVSDILRQAPREIIIEVSGGCVTNVSGLPANWNYKLIDHDNE